MGISRCPTTFRRIFISLLTGNGTSCKRRHKPVKLSVPRSQRGRLDLHRRLAYLNSLPQRSPKLKLKRKLRQQQEQ